jgi:hypothetical protein
MAEEKHEEVHHHEPKTEEHHEHAEKHIAHHEAKTEHHAEKSEPLHAPSPKKGKDYTWQIVSGILLILFVLSLFSNGFSFGTTGGKAMPTEEAKKKAIGYINENLLPAGTTASINGITESNGLYKINLSVAGRNYDSYMSKDGTLLFPSGIDITKTVEKAATTETQEEPPAEMKKAEKSKAELFVMTHCPYGTQAEKGLLPAIDALKGKADVTVRFVHYFMHGDKEEQETYREVCIREEQKDKFLKYLTCFLNASDSAGCLKSTGVDEAKLKTCIDTKSKDYYAADSALSKKYGVQGSPTLIINEAQANFYPRSPASALSLICSGFNTEPAECKTTLPTANPSPGFGWGAQAATASQASCS